MTHHLANMEIYEVALQWFTSFLNGQGHMVVLGKEISSSHPLECRVQQNAILSLMLFNI